mgnify:CR=1 FL=1|jgi:hypothetical protein
MKYITIPKDLVLGKNDEGEEVKQSFVEWLGGSPLNGKPFGADGKSLRMAVKIEERFKGKSEGDVVPLQDDEHAKLLDSSENPEGGFITGPAKFFLIFMDAVNDATDVEPAND